MTNGQLEYQIWTHVLLALSPMEYRIESRINSQVSVTVGGEVWYVVRSQGRVSSITQPGRRVKALIWDQLAGGADA